MIFYIVWSEGNMLVQDPDKTNLNDAVGYTQLVNC